MIKNEEQIMIKNNSQELHGNDFDGPNPKEQQKIQSTGTIWSSKEDSQNPTNQFQRKEKLHCLEQQIQLLQLHQI